MSKVEKEKVVKRAGIKKGPVSGGEEKHKFALELLSRDLQLAQKEKKMGIDTSTANELIKNSRERIENAIKIEDYTIAIDDLVKARKSMIGLLHDYNSAKKSITELDRMISHLEKRGISISVLKKKSEQAKAHFSDNDNNAAVEIVKTALKIGKRKERDYDQVSDMKMKIKTRIKQAESINADILNSKRIYNVAVNKIESGDYANAIRKLKECNSNIEKAVGLRKKQMEKNATGILATLEKDLQELVKLDAKTDDAKKLLVKLKKAIENKDLKLVSELEALCINSIEVTKNLYEAEKSLKEAKTLIKSSKEILDVRQAEELVEQARKNIGSGDYVKARENAEDSIDYIKNSISESPPNIIIEFPEQLNLTKNAWSKLQFKVENSGIVHAKKVEFNIPDKFETEGLFPLEYIKGGESRTMTVGLRTTEFGEIPLRLNIRYYDPVKDSHVEDRKIFWTKSTTTDTAGMKFMGEQEGKVVDAPKPEGEVRVLSEIEFFQGYVRLKIGVKNERSTVITESKLDLEFDDSIMRLEYIEPEFQRKNSRIILGNIQPNEKKTIAFYLDPLICTESNIDGTLTYKDIYGELRTTAMKRRRAEVVCPILYTPENINTAMLKRLINEELTIHDSKIYDIPPGLEFQRAAEICRDTVLGHDLKFIREFIEHDIDDPEIETWYYGTTKVKKQKVVIKASSRKKTNTVELFAACEDKKILTGFLAELGHNFNDKLKQLGITRKQIYPTTDQSIRNEILQTNTLLNHQYIDKTALSISKRGSEYEIAFKTSEKQGEASELSEFIKVSPGSRNDLINKIHQVVTFINVFSCTRGSVDGPEIEWEGEEQNDESQPDVKEELIRGKMDNLLSYGQLLYSMFLPVPIQNHLKSINEPIILKTNDNEIPWELLHDDSQFLCLKVPIGRRLKTREIPRTNPRKSSDGIRFLFIVNPTGDLEGSEKEVDYIREHLGSDVKIDILKRSEATSAAILAAFRSGNYDIIHYAGHAEFNADSPDESALISADKNRIFAQEIKRVIGGKPFVFLNACSSGREKLCEDDTSYTGSDTEGLASSFIMGGAMGFIGASWPLPDISAGMLASEFYNQLLKGETIGESLRRARLHLKNERPGDINWMAFTLFGDPTMSLERH